MACLRNGMTRPIIFIVVTKSSESLWMPVKVIIQKRVISRCILTIYGVILVKKGPIVLIKITRNFKRALTWENFVCWMLRT